MKNLSSLLVCTAKTIADLGQNLLFSFDARTGHQTPKVIPVVVYEKPKKLF